MDFLIFDLETNGLLADVNTIHSLVIKNVTTKEDSDIDVSIEQANEWWK